MGAWTAAAAAQAHRAVSRPIGVAVSLQEAQRLQAETEHAQRLGEALGIGIGLFQGCANFALNSVVLLVLYYGGARRKRPAGGGAHAPRPGPWPGPGSSDASMGAGSLVASGAMSGGDLMAFLVSTQQMQRSLTQLSELFGHVLCASTAGRRIWAYIQLRPDAALTGGRTLETVRGEICFDNVSFAYPTRAEREVLRNMQLRISAGSVVALCGESGAGKSTVALLLERFYEPRTGRILLDGCDVRSIDAAWLRGRIIGYINQEPTLFHTTILENIRYGRPDATLEEVREAARLANADDFIRAFPSGTCDPAAPAPRPCCAAVTAGVSAMCRWRRRV